MVPDLPAPWHLFRVYKDHECGEDGYPHEWHQLSTPPEMLEFAYGSSRIGIKDLVRAEADNRCIRCGHPYMVGARGKGEWSPCDRGCHHPGPARMRVKSEVGDERWVKLNNEIPIAANPIEARWRILTVHHLNGNKADCRWWNLAALCQRCHLTIQGKVKMERPYDKQHSAWFVPYVAGFYAAKYLGEDLTRVQALARADELLALEFRQDALFDRSAT